MLLRLTDWPELLLELWQSEPKLYKVILVMIATQVKLMMIGTINLVVRNHYSLPINNELYFGECESEKNYSDHFTSSAKLSVIDNLHVTVIRMNCT